MSMNIIGMPMSLSAFGDPAKNPLGGVNLKLAVSQLNGLPATGGANLNGTGQPLALNNTMNLAATPNNSAQPAGEAEEGGKGKGKGRKKDFVPPGLAKKKAEDLPDGNPFKEVLARQEADAKKAEEAKQTERDNNNVALGAASALMALVKGIRQGGQPRPDGTMASITGPVDIDNAPVGGINGLPMALMNASPTAM